MGHEEHRHEEGGLGAPLVQPPGERRGQVRAGGTSGASELEWTAGHADRPAKDSRMWPVGELFDNGSSLSGSGVIRAGERWWRARSSRANRKTCTQW